MSYLILSYHHRLPCYPTHLKFFSSLTSINSSSVSTLHSIGKHRALFDSGMWEFLDLSAEPVLLELDPSIPLPAQAALAADPSYTDISHDSGPFSPHEVKDQSSAVSASDFTEVISVSPLPPPTVDNNSEPVDPSSSHPETTKSAASSSYFPLFSSSLSSSFPSSSSSKTGSRSSTTAPSIVKTSSYLKPASEGDLPLPATVTVTVTAPGVALLDPAVVASTSTSATATAEVGTDNNLPGLGVEKRIKKRARDPEMDSYSSFPSSSSSSASSSSSSSSSSYFTAPSTQYQSSNSSKHSTYSSTNKYSR